MQAEKQLLLDQLREMVEGTPSFIITRQGNQRANDAYFYRQRLRKANARLEVVRKRVFLRAAEGAQVNIGDDWAGQIGIVFAEGDFAEASKAILTYAKENESQVEVLGGWYEGNLCDAGTVKRIASLPSRDEMRAQLLGTFEAPMAEFLAVAEALLTSMPHILQNKADLMEPSA